MITTQEIRKAAAKLDAAGEPVMTDERLHQVARLLDGTDRLTALLSSKVEVGLVLLQHVSDCHYDSVLATLRALQRAQQTVESAIATAVEQARAEGASFRQIAEALELDSGAAEAIRDL